MKQHRTIQITPELLVEACKTGARFGDGVVTKGLPADARLVWARIITVGGGVTAFELGFESDQFTDADPRRSDQIFPIELTAVPVSGTVAGTVES